jgi:hypothetical protein
VDKFGNALEILEKLAGNSWWKMAGNRCGFPQEIFGDGFPQAVWKGKQLFCGKLGGKCGKVKRGGGTISSS